MTLYAAVAADLARMIRDGTLKDGAALPSVRALCRTRRISPATVLRAYEALEAEGLVESKPRSGFYARARRAPDPPRTSTPRRSATRLQVADLVFATLEASRHRETVPLGSAFPSPTLFPWQRLARELGSGARHMDPWSTVESLPPGSLQLRRQISRRYLRLGMTVSVEEIVITAGALEALNLALQTLTRPGDTVAIESPTFYGCLQSVQRLGLNAVEIPTDPVHGLVLEALKRVLGERTVHACWFMTTLQHPTGATMPEARKRELVRLLAARNIPLIEDDAYAELQFGAPAPPAKSFDRQGLVLHAGSFAKCLAPGYRVGWIAAGQFAERVARAKMESSIATSLPVQQGLARMLTHGGYEAHLVALRRTLATQQAALLAALERHFPSGYRVSRPPGGYFLWVECAATVNALEVHRAALESGITLAPGPIFSARREFAHFLRLNSGHPWSPALERAVARIGQLLRDPRS